MQCWQGCWSALLAASLAPFVVVNRIVFVAGGIAHAAYGGVGMGFFFRFNPFWGALGFSLLAALGMGVIQRKNPTAPGYGDWHDVGDWNGNRGDFCRPDGRVYGKSDQLFVWQHPGGSPGRTCG